MSEMSTVTAQSVITTQTASTRQAMQAEFVRQQAGADRAVAEILQQSIEQGKATLPAGQGQNADISA